MEIERKILKAMSGNLMTLADVRACFPTEEASHVQRAILDMKKKGWIAAGFCYNRRVQEVRVCCVSQEGLRMLENWPDNPDLENTHHHYQKVLSARQADLDAIRNQNENLGKQVARLLADCAKLQYERNNLEAQILKLSTPEKPTSFQQHPIQKRHAQ